MFPQQTQETAAENTGETKLLNAAPSPKDSLSPKTDGEMSCGSWVVDGSGFLSPTGPALKEVLDLVDGVRSTVCKYLRLPPLRGQKQGNFCLKDLDGWCNLAEFHLPEDSPSPERHQFRLEGSALQELSKGSKGELIPISPGGITPPSILTCRHRRRVALSPDTTMTPKNTPVKHLPFSPSQVGLNTKKLRKVYFRCLRLTQFVFPVPEHVDQAGHS